MKQRTHTPKNSIILQLKKRGITMKRAEKNGIRVWQLSDGHAFEHLRQVAMVYGVSKKESK